METISPITWYYCSLMLLHLLKTTEVLGRAQETRYKMDEEEGQVVVTNVYGDICVRKARRKRQHKIVQEILYEYATNTSLHGLPYTTRRGLTIIEKIFWVITFIASLCLCSYFIYSVWFKWKNSPVLVTVNEHLVPVSEILFPSVTICPQSKCLLSKYNFSGACESFKYIDYSFIRSYETNRTSDFNATMLEAIAKLEDVSLVCGNALTPDFTSILPRNFSDKIIDHITEISPKNKDIFLACLLRNDYFICSDIFKTVLTKEGVCYNINSLDAAELFREKSIPKELQMKYMTTNTMDENNNGPNWTRTFPLYGKENGDSPDLEVIFKVTEKDNDDWCNSLSSGFKVYIQHPTDLPQSSLYYYAVLDDQVSSMAISVNIINTSQSLEIYSPEIRQCYFPHERYLKYYKIYTASNCRIECLTNITLEICKCVGFYMPHEEGVKTCGIQQKDCETQAYSKLVERESNPETAACRCLLACNSIDYDAEILKTNFNLEKLMQIYGKMFNWSPIGSNQSTSKYSKLEMYFKRPRFLSMRRSEMFGIIDFLANCGGLLGLFLGFSFLSLVELFYFVTLRLCCTLKKDLEEEKKLTKATSKSK